MSNDIMYSHEEIVILSDGRKLTYKNPTKNNENQEFHHDNVNNLLGEINKGPIKTR